MVCPVKRKKKEGCSSMGERPEKEEEQERGKKEIGEREEREIERERKR
jgi:hypothetical protein